MKKYLILFTALLIAAPCFAQPAESKIPETTLIFVRHAEKLDDGTDNPSLNEIGKKRAEQLAGLMLKNYKISAVYSTPYKRTQETAAPLADSLGISVIEYGLHDPKSIVEEWIVSYPGEQVLIVGHSNTTPMLVNVVIGEDKFPKLDESSYGEYFVVKAAEVGEAKVQHLSY